MHIAVFTDSYVPYVSGVVESIQTFKSQLETMGHDVYVVAPSYPGYKKHEERIFRLPAVPVPSNPGFTVAIPVALTLRGRLTKYKPDMIHVHSPFVAGRLGARYARYYRVPLVFTYHTRYDQYLHYVPVPQSLTEPITTGYIKDYIGLCDAVVTPSQGIANLLIKQKIPKKKLHVIPTGVDVDKFCPDQGEGSSSFREQYGIEKSRKVLVYAGRLAKEKNLDFLIKVMARLKQNRDDVSLLIVGGGPYEEHLKESCQDLGLEIGKDVIFTGRMPHEKLVNAYRAGDVFVFGSLSETQGLVVLEAMSVGLPVVALDGMGINEVLEDGKQGFLIPAPKDHHYREISAWRAAVEVFIDHVLRLLSDQELHQKFSTEARKQALSHSSEAMAKKLASLYEDLAHS